MIPSWGNSTSEVVLYEPKVVKPFSPKPAPEKLLERQNSHEKKMKAVTEMIADCIENRTEQWNQDVAAEITKCVTGMKKSEDETLSLLIELLYNDKMLDKESNRYQLELADSVEKKHQRVNAGLKTVQQNGGAEVRVINGIIDGDCEEELPSGPRVLKSITPASLYDPLNPATMPLRLKSAQ